MKQMLMAFVGLGAWIGAACAAEMNVDVLVVGGTTRGVEAAKAAKSEGKSVYLVTPYAYLGEDMASTLELGFDAGRSPKTELECKLWSSVDGLAPYDYFPARITDGIRWVYRNDGMARLAEPGNPPTMDDCVLYLDDIDYRCVLRKPAKISRVGVLVAEADRFIGSCFIKADAFAELERTKKGVTKVATKSVEMKFLAGPRKGETLVLKNRGRQFDIPAGLFYPGGRAVLFECEVNGEISEAQITLRADPSAHHQLVSRMWFHLSESKGMQRPPSPLKVKRTCDRELLEAGVEFITSSPVRRVLRDNDGSIVGVEIVNRSGRKEIRARKVVDATLYGTLGVIPKVGPTAKFSRIVVGDRDRPSALGMEVEELPSDLRDVHTGFTGRMYRCTFELPMKDGSYPSFAAAEWKARELTKQTRAADEADVLVWHPSADALSSAEAQGDELPVWGEYDVVVVGGGTAGSPAGLAAARSGAKTLIVEYRDMLGGIGSDGMVTGYFDGNKCGFVDEFVAECKKSRGLAQYCRAETWHRLCSEAGATVWLGAMGLGVIREGTKVVGVEVSTPLGTGIVRAKCVIDGTGSSDVAAAAGAETELVSAKEIAVQSAGQSPQRIGGYGVNSDFGYLNDADAADLWLFGIRARAGAPDAWDLAKLPDSRERRRIVPDCRLSGEDAVAKRRYPDTIAQALSRQDPHGYLTDDFGFLSETTTENHPSKNENRAMFRVNLPLRCMLPKGVDGIAVVGLSAGIERDVLAITRMQADLMNMGYGVGVAAAMAVAKGGDFRQIDHDALRAKLVEKGILASEALNWNEEDDVSSDALIAQAVKTLPDGYRGGHVIYRRENRTRAIPLLRDAYVAATDAGARQTYALALGLMGDATGVDTLVECVCDPDSIVNVRSSGSSIHMFAAAYSAGEKKQGMMLALARTRHPKAAQVLMCELNKLKPGSPLNEVREMMLVVEAYGSKSFAAPLAKLLQSEGMHGYAVEKIADLNPTGGYGIGPEYRNCFRELAMARALMACGDFNCVGRKTFEVYAKDPRGLLSAHAKAVLAAYPAAGN